MAEGLSSPATFTLPRKLSHLTPDDLELSATVAPRYLLHQRFWIPTSVIMYFSLASNPFAKWIQSWNIHRLATLLPYPTRDPFTASRAARSTGFN